MLGNNVDFLVATREKESEGERDLDLSVSAFLPLSLSFSFPLGPIFSFSLSLSTRSVRSVIVKALDGKSSIPVVLKFDTWW